MLVLCLPAKNIINMRYIFSSCSSIEELELSSFNTKNATNMEGIFGEFNILSHLDLSKIDAMNPPEDIDTVYIQ